MVEDGMVNGIYSRESIFDRAEPFDPLERARLLKEHIPTGHRMICSERARLVTESYRQTEGEPFCIRNSRALYHVLENMSLHITDGELIVGNLAGFDEDGRPMEGVYPEFRWKPIYEHLDCCFSERLYDRDREALREVLPYWENRCTEDLLHNQWPEQMAIYEKNILVARAPFSIQGYGHFAPNYRAVLNKGLVGINHDLEQALAKLDPHDEDYAERRNFYQAMMISCRAAIIFALRFSEIALEIAAGETDPVRKAELEKIAEICQRVPAFPARSFWEALQSFWFTHIILQIEDNGVGIAPGRFDQYMYPYYKADIESGNMTRDQAKELLGCLWVKFLEPGVLKDQRRTLDTSGGTLFQNMVIGGQTPDGKDATNDLSYLILEVVKETRLTQPSISLKYHPAIPDNFMMEALDVIKSGMGFPALFNDTTYMQFMLSKGVTIEDARDVVFASCVEPLVDGKTAPHSDCGHLIVAKCVEMTLNDGKDLDTGLQLGPSTGDPAKFESYEEVREAFYKQLSYVIDVLCTGHLVTERIHTERVTLPFVSSLFESCIQTGRSCKDGGTEYDFPYAITMSTPNAADSLAAIKKLVFEEKKLTMEELVKTLREDFKGREDIRQMLINRAPKYGNDDDYVDSIAVEIYDFIRRRLNSMQNRRGTPFEYTGLTVAMNIPYGKTTAATPDGRHAGDPLADGGLSPQQGYDTNGPTAVLSSVTKLDHAKMGGMLLNLKISPTSVRDDEGMRNWLNLIKSYFAMGGHQIQFNIIDRETLLDAKAHPENHTDLIVRVAGYSAYFTQLDPEVQDHIIARIEQEL